MQYDVKSAFATGDAAMANFRTRIKGVFYAVATPGDPLIFHDNASAASGDIVLKLPASVAGQHTVGIPGVGLRTAENWLKERTKDFESFAIRKDVEKFGMVEGITEFFKNFNLVYLLKTDEDLARHGLRLPPLQCIDISQDELDIWKDD